MDINKIIQRELKNNLSEQFQLWELYLPSREIIDNFANSQKDIGDPLCEFYATGPTRPNSTQQANNDGTQIIDTSLYSITILEIPQEITRKHVFKLKDGSNYYSSLTDIAPDLTGKTISRISIQLL